VLPKEMGKMRVLWPFEQQWQDGRNASKLSAKQTTTKWSFAVLKKDGIGAKQRTGDQIKPSCNCLGQTLCSLVATEDCHRGAGEMLSYHQLVLFQRWSRKDSRMASTEGTRKGSMVEVIHPGLCLSPRILMRAQSTFHLCYLSLGFNPSLHMSDKEMVSKNPKFTTPI
jgi:hypothetical protein